MPWRELIRCLMQRPDIEKSIDRVALSAENLRRELSGEKGRDLRGAVHEFAERI